MIITVPTEAAQMGDGTGEWKKVWQKGVITGLSTGMGNE